MKLLITLTLVLMSLPTLLFAVDTSGNYAIWGVGKKACFAYNKDNADSEKQNYKSYIKGFLTAYNIFTEKTYSISGRMDEAEIFQWLYSYCAENPMSSLENALTSFTFDHYDKRMKSSRSGIGR